MSARVHMAKPGEGKRLYVIPQNEPGYALAVARCRLLVREHNTPPAPINPHPLDVDGLPMPSSNTGHLAQFEPLPIHEIPSPDLDINDLETFWGVSAKGSLFGVSK